MMFQEAIKFGHVVYNDGGLADLQHHVFVFLQDTVQQTVLWHPFPRRSTQHYTLRPAFVTPCGVCNRNSLTPRDSFWRIS